VLSLLLYGSFVYAQMSSHREDFVEELVRAEEGKHIVAKDGIAFSVLLLFAGLAGIVLLAEDIAAGVEDGLGALQVSQSDAIVGAFIAALVLLPEAFAAVRASLRNELQRSLNIALGSACATIGLTIPAVAVASLITGRSLTLGLNPGDIVLLLLGLGISVISFATGRTSVLTGLVHLVVFCAYVFLIFLP
jgi:Ca2+:H+ antiporter